MSASKVHSLKSPESLPGLHTADQTHETHLPSHIRTLIDLTQPSELTEAPQFMHNFYANSIALRMSVPVGVQYRSDVTRGTELLHLLPHFVPQQCK